MTDFDAARKGVPPPVPPPPYSAVVRASERSLSDEESIASSPPSSFWGSPTSTHSTLYEDDYPQTPYSAQLFGTPASPSKRPLPALPSPSSPSLSAALSASPPASQPISRNPSHRRPSRTLKPPTRNDICDALRLQFAIEASLKPSMYATWFGHKAQFPCGCAPCSCAEGNNAHPRHLPCPLQPGMPIERNCGA